PRVESRWRYPRRCARRWRRPCEAGSRGPSGDAPNCATIEEVRALIVSHDLTIVSMIVNASIVVKVVMAILLLASMFSWTYIFMKIFAIGRARRQADAF